MFVKSVMLCIICNGIPFLHTLLIRYHQNISNEKQELLNFWIPFASKFFAYTVILYMNFNIFLNPISDGKITSSFHSLVIKFTPDYSEELFICREDQTAYNLIIYVIFALIC